MTAEPPGELLSGAREQPALDPVAAHRTRPVYRPNLDDIRAGWEPVPHTLLRTPNAALTIPTLVAVSTYQRGSRPATVKARQLAADLGLEESTVRRRLRELLDAGELVEVERRPGAPLSLRLRHRRPAERFEPVHRGIVRTGGATRPEAVALYVALSARQGTAPDVVVTFADLALDIDRSRRFVADLVHHLAATDVVTLERCDGQPYRAVVHRPRADVVPLRRTAGSAA